MNTLSPIPYATASVRGHPSAPLRTPHAHWHSAAKPPAPNPESGPVRTQTVTHHITAWPTALTPPLFPIPTPTRSESTYTPEHDVELTEQSDDAFLAYLAGELDPTEDDGP